MYIYIYIYILQKQSIYMLMCKKYLQYTTIPLIIDLI